MEPAPWSCGFWASFIRSFVSILPTPSPSSFSVFSSESQKIGINFTLHLAFHTLQFFLFYFPFPVLNLDYLTTIIHLLASICLKSIQIDCGCVGRNIKDSPKDVSLAWLVYFKGKCSLTPLLRSRLAITHIGDILIISEVLETEVVFLAELSSEIEILGLELGLRMK